MRILGMFLNILQQNPSMTSNAAAPKIVASIEAEFGSKFSETTIVNVISDATKPWIAKAQ
jgi:hypothetical protein